MEETKILDTILEVKKAIDSDGDEGLLIHCRCSGLDLSTILRQLLERDPNIEVILLNTILEYRVEQIGKSIGFFKRDPLEEMFPSGFPSEGGTEKLRN